MSTLKLIRPAAIEAELSDGRAIIVQPATRAQIRAALAIDPADEEERGETMADKSARLSLQLAALVGGSVVLVTYEDGQRIEQEVPAGPILATLTPAEEEALFWAQWGASCGYPPGVAVAALQKKNLLDAVVVASASPVSTATPPNSPTPSIAR